MDIVFLLVPLSVVLVFAIAVMFWWSVHTGQFDDLERQGRTVVDDIDTPPSGAAASAAPAPVSGSSSASASAAGSGDRTPTASSSHPAGPGGRAPPG